MKASVRPFAFALVLAAFGLASAPLEAFAASTLAGVWQITYYLDPTGSVGSTQCIVVNVKSHANGVRAGKWFSPTLKGWHGEWVQKGEHFAFHGFTSSNVATYDVGDLINPNLASETSAGVLSYAKGSVTTVDTGTAALVMVSSCTGASSRGGDDPMRDR
jgi:hypothetical protein